MATFLLEVGTEELPASFVASAIEQWRSRVPASLNEQFLTPTAIHVYGTPRRLAVVIEGLPDRQLDRVEDAKGPSVQAAFQGGKQDGQPTKAAEGFARSRGVSIDDFEIRTTEKGEFVFVKQTLPGRPTADILTELVPTWIFGLEGKRFMRWGDGDQRFSRPVRWLVTLWDQAVLPLTLVNGAETCVSDRLSQGHRVLHPNPVSILSAADYVATLGRAFVEVDPAQRRQTILTQTQKVAEEVGGVASINPGLLNEVVNLVEYPTAVVGKFDPEFLAIPAEVLVMEMESHQRYFPVFKSDASNASNASNVSKSEDATDLLPCFVTISNGDPAKSAIIAEGNGRVIRARLSDGRYFFDLDCKQTLESYLPRLETVTFQEDLGSVRQKIDRVVQIAGQVAAQLQVSAADRTQILRAALLCKADLVTQMVGEFPELQGVMGEKYARSSGELEAVAIAIMEHYLPKGAGDRLPQTLAGQVVGIADRLDTLVGIFSVGLVPTGSSDPFALRRAANAIVNIAWAADLPLNLEQLLDQVIADYRTGTIKDKDPDPVGLRHQLRDFFLQRIRTLLQDERQIDYDLVNAALGENDPEYSERALQDVLDVRDRARFLQAIRTTKTLDAIYETVNRSTRLAKQGELDTRVLDPTALVDPHLFEKPSEHAFYNALVKLVPQTQQAQTERNYQTLLDALTQAVPVVSQFFDGADSVMVMAEDAAVRRNRLNLLGLLRNHARVLADFGAIVK